MALTQGAWAATTVNELLVLKCTVTSTTGETDTYTLKTPERTDASSFDPTKSWALIVNAAATDISDGTDVVDIWAGYSDSFVMSGDSTTTTATDGVEIGSAVITGVSDAVGVCIVDPNFFGTKVQGNPGTPVEGHVNVGTAPYYAINVDGGAARKAADTIFYIIQ